MVYLIHFEAKLKHAQHYLGFCSENGLQNRLDAHHSGQGSALMRAVTEAEIPWSVVRTWKLASRTKERQLHLHKNSWRLCPVCNPHNFEKHGG